MEHTPWGWHTLFDCFECDKNLITDPENIKAFTKTLVGAIDMKAFGEPLVVHFATHDPSKGGYSLCQLIETSLIDGHFVDATGDAYITVHSCKTFDPSIAGKVISDFFKPKKILEQTVLRGVDRG